MDISHDELDAIIDRLASRIASKLQPMAIAILNKENKIMASIQDVQNDVTAETSLIDSVSTLMAGLQQQIKDALAGVTLPPAVQAQIDAVFTTAESNKAAITKAIADNTPVPPAAVA